MQYAHCASRTQAVLSINQRAGYRALEARARRLLSATTIEV
jgi:hypothetical protein